MHTMSIPAVHSGLSCPQRSQLFSSPRPNRCSLPHLTTEKKICVRTLRHHNHLALTHLDRTGLHTGNCRGDRLAAAASSAAAGSPSSDVPPPSLLSKFAAFVSAFWRFLRPHTIRGTILGSTAVTCRALLENPQVIDWGLVPRAVLGVLALLCGNGFIVGINQIYDKEIDQVNKPFLPVAAEDLSTGVAWILVVALAVAGIGVTSQNFGPLITGLYSFGLFLGTIYSVPPLRLKRFAVPAFMIIAIVRGFLLNFGVYYATRSALMLPFQWSPAIVFITIFVTVFATAIAITKDLADVKGDLKFKIDTFATRVGVRNITFLGTGLLLSNYIGAIVVSILKPGMFRAPFMIGAHALLALKLIMETANLDSAEYTQPAIRRYYAWVWNLFYAEYALFVCI